LALTVSAFSGTNSCFLEHRASLIVGGFYDLSGNLTWFMGNPPLGWKNPLGFYAKPVAGATNDAYVAGLTLDSSRQPLLQKSLAGGTIVWTQALGTVEQWVLAADSAFNLFLADTNGVFSKYDADGNFIWSTNYPLPVTLMLLDSQGNRFVSFTDGSMARLQSDAPAQAPTIATGPQSRTLFVGDNLILSVAANGTLPLRYAWRLYGTNIRGATSATLALNSATPADAGPYTVVVTNVAGAVTSAPPAMLRVKSVELYLGSQLLTNGTYVFASPPTLSIRSAFASGSAFYNLDGSFPSFSSTYYSGPFTLARSSTVRAIGYSSDFSQFEEADTVYATVLVNHALSVLASVGGSVSLSPTGGTYVATNVVTAAATPTAGSSFLYWLGDAAGTNPAVSTSMERDKTIQAVFGTTLSTAVAGNGQVLLYPPGGLYPYGAVVRLTGMPQPGNYFGFWGNAATGNTNPLFFSVASPTQTVSSIFGAVQTGQAALTVLISGHGRVNANPRANVYPVNQSVTLTAAPDPGESFLNWTGDASGIQNPLTLSMSQDKAIIANFTSRPFLRVNRPGVEGLSSDGFRLTLNSDPQSTWQILGSTNLSLWETIGAITNSFGEAQFTDPGAPDFSMRFYKAAPMH